MILLNNGAAEVALPKSRFTRYYSSILHGPSLQIEYAIRTPPLLRRCFPVTSEYVASIPLSLTDMNRVCVLFIGQPVGTAVDFFSKGKAKKITRTLLPFFANLYVC